MIFHRAGLTVFEDETPPELPAPLPNPFLIGLDLGQQNDPTALAILKRTPILDDAGQPLRDAQRRDVAKFDLIHLVRYPLGTSYPALVKLIIALVSEPRVQAPGRPRMAIDATGVGRPVVDLFLDARPEADLSPITITGGFAVVRELWNKTKHISYRVPKVELVSTVQAGLQSGRLKVAPSLPLADTLKGELAAFQVKVSKAAHESYNAREGYHDDLVLSVALACWLGSQKGRSSITVR